jgi:hypothetical protein
VAWIVLCCVYVAGGISGGGAATVSSLREMFAQFATFGAPPAGAHAPSPNRPVEMDGARFQKLCRECRLFDGQCTPGKGGAAPGFNPTRADLIFTKVKQQVGASVRVSTAG